MQQNPRIGIGVFVFKGGKFLIGQRKGAHGANSWSLPGGHLEFGESPEQTASREVMEETGLSITNIRFGALTNDIFSQEDKHYVTIWMISEWESGKQQIMEPDKFIAQKWTTFDSLPEDLFLPWQNLMKSQFYDKIIEESDKTKGVNNEV